MNSDVDAFCKSCITCQTSKLNNHANYGLLETLDIPNYPWETIGIDFVGPLPESKTLNGTFDMILVVIDHLTSMVHLIPTKQTYRAKDVAEVMFDRVYKHHGMPRHIVSDRDSLFTSVFWNRLNELTGTELHMSSSFHPQTDGMTERANQTITQMIRSCISPHQRDWATKLPAIEFAINSARSETTGFAPFTLNYGQIPKSMIWETDMKYPGVRTFAQQMKDAIMRAHDSIIAARVKQTRLANNRRKETPFVKGDLVYLSTANLTLPKGRARKLAPKFIGPFQILEDYCNNTFLLDIPAELKKRGIHPAFHASLLRVHVPNDDRRFPGRQLPQIIGLGKVEELNVKNISDHHGKGADALFEVLYTNGDSVWLLYLEVKQLEALSQYLEAQGAPTVNDLPRRVRHADKDIPISSIQLDETIRCRLALDLIDDVVTNIASATTSKPPSVHSGTSSDLRSCKNVYRGWKRGPKRQRSTRSRMAHPVFRPLQLEQFRITADAIRSGTFDLSRDRIPTGYVTFCETNANHPDPNLRYPLPYGFVRKPLRSRENKTHGHHDRRDRGKSLSGMIFDRFKADTKTRKEPIHKVPSKVYAERRTETATTNNSRPRGRHSQDARAPSRNHRRARNITSHFAPYQQPVAYPGNALFNPAPAVIPNPAVHQVVFNKNAVIPNPAMHPVVFNENVANPAPAAPTELETLEELLDDIINDGVPANSNASTSLSPGMTLIVFLLFYLALTNTILVVSSVTI